MKRTVALAALALLAPAPASAQAVGGFLGIEWGELIVPHLAGDGTVAVLAGEVIRIEGVEPVDRTALRYVFIEPPEREEWRERFRHRQIEFTAIRDEDWRVVRLKAWVDLNRACDDAPAIEEVAAELRERYAVWEPYPGRPYTFRETYGDEDGWLEVRCASRALTFTASSRMFDEYVERLRR